ncbi:MAG: hypothetical protein PHS17_16945, partial [Desulfobacterales bacterium]|nr:hypothetical protein [Desulfobacterales bacterium]
MLGKNTQKPGDEGPARWLSHLNPSFLNSIIPAFQASAYSHSMVPGGFEEISRTTRFTPLTLLMI